MNLDVLCVKWGDKFSTDYVHKLYNMVKRNLTIPYRFICFTDNPNSLNPDIRTVRLQQGFEYCWNKLELFRPDHFSKETLCLYIDLDVVITDNIDDLVTVCPQDKFIGLYDWYCNNQSDSGIFRRLIGSAKRHMDNSHYNSSVMRFYGNDHTNLNNALIEKLKDGTVRWEREHDAYLQSHDKVVLWEGKKRYGSDQEWISHYIYPLSELKKHSFPDGWIMSYKKHGRDGLPKGCKIMVFHGYPKPHEVNNDYVKEHWR
jgi:hypothetical protein